MKTLLIAFALGLFGAVAVTVSFSLQWPTWVMFIAWVSFYIFGKTVQSSLKVFLHIALGMLMAVLIQLTAAFLTPMIGTFGFALSVFFYIGSLAYFARSKSLNNIPAWFLGLIILFGVHPPLEPAPILQLFIPIIAGFIFAWLNNAVVEKLHNLKHPKEAASH